MAGDVSATERWDEEARFFDEFAARAAAGLAPIDDAVVRRYKSVRHSLYLKEFMFELIGDLGGKVVLDVGCGDGENAVLLAKLGARVTGLDVSPKAIEVARRRAELNGVSKRTEFFCSPLERAELPARSFDVIWCDNILHHVIPMLGEVMEQLTRWAKRDALMVLAEPINLSPTLRKIRFLVPVHTEVTPGERPLERPELEIVARHVRGLSRRHFGFLGRLNRFILPGCIQYEKASAVRRLLCDALALADGAILRIPGLKSLGGLALLHGRAP